MSDLDDSLKEIYREWLSENCYSEDKATELIHQAFTDAGYRKLPKEKDMQSLVNAGLAEFMMTGQEWYDRFEKELPDTKLKEYLPSAEMKYSRNRVMEAAKRAAGIE